MAATSQQKSSSMSRVSALEHTCIGGLAAVVEVLTMQPFLYMKNALQEGRSIPLNPFPLYRGVLINALSMAPITAIQFGTNRAGEQLSEILTGHQPSQMGRIFIAGTAGILSAFVGTPSELIILHQQKSGRSLWAETKHFVRTYGPIALFRGLGTCIAREAMYAGGYLGMFPVLREYLDSRPDFHKYPAGTSLLVSGVASGVLAAVFSHPFDTVKTRLQGHMYSRPEYMNSHVAAKSPLKEGGIGAFWKGVLPRGFRIVCACFILNGTKNTAVEHLERYRGPKCVTGEDDVTRPEPEAQSL